MKKPVYFDTEIYPNHFCAAFASEDRSVQQVFEYPLDVDRIRNIYRKRDVIGFNTLRFDFAIMSLALNNYPIADLWLATQMIIERKMNSWDVLDYFNCREIKPDSFVDLIALVPPKVSLKLAAARLGARTLQDLPIKPGTMLTAEQKVIVNNYCVNDLYLTQVLHSHVKPEIELREMLGAGLRSKTDAQVAEELIAREAERETGFRPKRPDDTRRAFTYKPPSFIKFRSPALQKMLADVQRIPFDETCVAELPVVEIAGRTYKMGVGGLHSQEKAQTVLELMRDIDVTSYYPSLILAMGFKFQRIYKKLFDQRIAAKSAGDMRKSDSLKIALNGTFGKTGNFYTFLFDPEFMVRVTISGQLSLLMLIEMLTDAGLEVVSGNTDGVVVVEDKRIDKIVAEWEQQTGLKMEHAQYKALYSRDVNNYIAVKTDGKVKTKGVFAKPGLKKNPDAYICALASIEYLTKGVPVSETIRNCATIDDFLMVRTVKGGAEYVERGQTDLPDNIDKAGKRQALLVHGWTEQKKGRIVRYTHPDEDGEFTLGQAYDVLHYYELESKIVHREYIGRVVRFYWANSPNVGVIRYQSSGSQVPKSDRSRPLMALKEVFDVDEDRYIRAAIELIESTGVKYDESCTA